MITYKLNEEHWKIAGANAAQQPVFENSHREHQANEVGCLGELVIEQWLNLEAIRFTDDRSETTHDYRLADGQTVDVKTKDRTVPPKPFYDCSVPLYNHIHQKPTYYLFVSLERSSDGSANDIRRFHTAYILGGLNQKQLAAYGKVWKAGETDPSNGTKFWTDCINVPISKLASCETVINKWRAI